MRRCGTKQHDGAGPFGEPQFKIASHDVPCVQDPGGCNLRTCMRRAGRGLPGSQQSSMYLFVRHAGQVSARGTRLRTATTRSSRGLPRPHPPLPTGRPHLNAEACKRTVELWTSLPLFFFGRWLLHPRPPLVLASERSQCGLLDLLGGVCSSCLERSQLYNYLGVGSPS